MALLRLAALALTRNVTFVHFKALDSYPLRILYWLRPAATILIQSSAAGTSAVEAKLDELVKERNFPRHAPAAALLLYFTGNWPVLADPRVAGIPMLHISVPHQRSAWRHHLSAWGAELFQQTGLPRDGEVVTVMCNTMSTNDLLDPSTSFIGMFEETLKLIVEALPDLPILVKRHPATTPDMARRQDEIVRSIAHPIHFITLHPQLLAMYSRCFVAALVQHNVPGSRTGRRAHHSVQPHERTGPRRRRRQ